MNPIKHNTSRPEIKAGYEVRGKGLCRPSNTMYSHLQYIEGQNAKVVQPEFVNPQNQDLAKVKKACKTQQDSFAARKNIKANFNTRSSVFN